MKLSGNKQRHNMTWATWVHYVLGLQAWLQKNTLTVLFFPGSEWTFEGGGAMHSSKHDRYRICLWLGIIRLGEKCVPQISFPLCFINCFLNTFREDLKLYSQHDSCKLKMKTYFNDQFHKVKFQTWLWQNTTIMKYVVGVFGSQWCHHV